MTSYQRRCDVMSHRRRSDVMCLLGSSPIYICVIMSVRLGLVRYHRSLYHHGVIHTGNLAILNPFWSVGGFTSQSTWACRDKATATWVEVLVLTRTKVRLFVLWFYGPVNNCLALSGQSMSVQSNRFLDINPYMY